MTLFADALQPRDQAWTDLDGAESLALGRRRPVRAPRALARDMDDARVEIDIGPADGERLGDAGAGTDQELGERAVAVGAGIEVAVDLVQAQVVDLGPLDR